MKSKITFNKTKWFRYITYCAMLALVFVMLSFTRFSKVADHTDGNGNVTITGELRQWHTVTLTFDGPECSETDEYNPFFNYRLNVTFNHEKSGKSYVVPGYFAADGNAGMTSATSGNKWRVKFSPDEIGEWNYTVDFKKGKWVDVRPRTDDRVPTG